MPTVEAQSVEAQSVGSYVGSFSLSRIISGTGMDAEAEDIIESGQILTILGMT
jgi:hypothetical protein